MKIFYYPVALNISKRQGLAVIMRRVLLNINNDFLSSYYLLLFRTKNNFQQEVTRLGDEVGNDSPVRRISYQEYIPTKVSTPLPIIALYIPSELKIIAGLPCASTPTIPPSPLMATSFFITTSSMACCRV